MAIRLLRHVWRRTVSNGPRHRLIATAAPVSTPVTPAHVWLTRREALLVETGRRAA